MAAVAIPQAIAYASIAELPAQTGLYTAAIAAIVGALWGSSNQLHTGPTNAISLLILATLFTLVISNVGATVLLVPLVVNMAIAAHTDPRMAALVVGLATSNSFMLPTHQVNALYMGPGEYRTKDYIKIGGILSFIYIVILVVMVYVFYL